MGLLGFDSEDESQEVKHAVRPKKRLPLPSELDAKISSREQSQSRAAEEQASVNEDDDESYLDMKLEAQDAITHEQELEQAKLEKLIPDKRQRAVHESLNTSLFEKEEPSKGLSLMQKMGFKKEDIKAAPAPIGLSFNSGRAGIGFESERKRKVEEAVSKEYQQKKQHVEEFKESKRAEEDERHLRSVLRKAQTRLADLDAESKGVDSTELWNDLPPPDADLLYREPILEHQRIKYEAEARKKHMYGEPSPEPRPDLYKPDADLDEFISRPLQDQVASVVKQLRDTYYYCIFCGHRYTDADDLSANCPGQTEDDHN